MMFAFGQYSIAGKPPILRGAAPIQLHDSRMLRYERHHIRLAGDVPLRLRPTVQASDLRDITTGHLPGTNLHVANTGPGVESTGSRGGIRRTPRLVLSLIVSHSNGALTRD